MAKWYVFFVYLPKDFKKFTLYIVGLLQFNYDQNFLLLRCLNMNIRWTALCWLPNNNDTYITQNTLTVVIIICICNFTYSLG